MKLHPSITAGKQCPEVVIAYVRKHYAAILEQEQARGILPQEEELLRKLA